MIVNQRQHAAEHVRNKYNTLTPAEAKKLNRSLFSKSVNMTAAAATANSSTNQSSNNAYLYGTLRHAPVRTASVLHKPRAPPIIVTDLDTTIDQLDGASLGNYSSHSNNSSPQQHQHQLTRSASIRSASLCPTGVGAAVGAPFDARRNTVNYGRASTLNSRSSLYSNGSSSNNYLQQQQRRSIIYEQQLKQDSMDESMSNLSFKSSLDTPDCNIYDPCRLQTMSVDLGNHCAGSNRDSINSCQTASVGKRSHQQQQQLYDPNLRGQTIARIKYNTISNSSSKMFSDDSYSSSTKSGMSSSTLKQDSITPIKHYGAGGNGDTNSISSLNSRDSKRSRSASKASLSASTYRVFQSPFANFKRLFRNMPRPFSQAGETSEQKLDSSSLDHFAINASNDYTKELTASAARFHDKSIGDISISESISQISLNKSQSPPVCPPPPGELKSMCYMESAINYSNYDEFTKARNERMAQRQQAVKDNFNNSSSANHQQQHHATDDTHSMGSQESEAWQLTSLPVYFERNLTTVFEEKQQQQQQQASCEMTASNIGGGGGSRSSSACQQQRGDLAPEMQHQSSAIRPPMHFADDHHGDRTLTNDDIDRMKERKMATTMQPSGSMQSLNSCATTTSANRNHKHQAPQPPQLPPATPYRFSFAQPLQQQQQQQPLPTSLSLDHQCVIDQQVPLNQNGKQQNLGLPPRMPTDQRLTINTDSERPVTTHQQVVLRADQQQQRRQQHILDNNSSSGNSSNCSSQLNGINNCDRRNSLDSSDKNSCNSNSEDSAASTAGCANNNNNNNDINENNSPNGYGTLTDIVSDHHHHQQHDDVNDITLLSETSTLQGGDTGIAYYANKCSELERTVGTLKNKLISKEKELTDLQLSQLNNDYTIERLKKRVTTLERENAQLKARMAIKS